MTVPIDGEFRAGRFTTRVRKEKAFSPISHRVAFRFRLFAILKLQAVAGKSRDHRTRSESRERTREDGREARTLGRLERSRETIRERQETVNSQVSSPLLGWQHHHCTSMHLHGTACNGTVHLSTKTSDSNEAAEGFGGPSRVPSPPRLSNGEWNGVRGVEAWPVTFDPILSWRRPRTPSTEIRWGILSGEPPNEEGNVERGGIDIDRTVLRGILEALPNNIPPPPPELGGVRPVRTARPRVRSSFALPGRESGMERVKRVTRAWNGTWNASRGWGAASEVAQGSRLPFGESPSRPSFRNGSGSRRGSRESSGCYMGCYIMSPSSRLHYHRSPLRRRRDGRPTDSFRGDVMFPAMNPCI